MTLRGIADDVLLVVQKVTDLFACVLSSVVKNPLPARERVLVTLLYDGV